MSNAQAIYGVPTTWPPSGAQESCCCVETCHWPPPLWAGLVLSLQPALPHSCKLAKLPTQPSPAHWWCAGVFLARLLRVKFGSAYAQFAKHGDTIAGSKYFTTLLHCCKYALDTSAQCTLEHSWSDSDFDDFYLLSYTCYTITLFCKNKYLRSPLRGKIFIFPTESPVVVFLQQCYYRGKIAQSSFVEPPVLETAGLDLLPISAKHEKKTEIRN